MENLLCQRFNFFLILFSMTIAGYASVDSKSKQELILWIGFIICFVLSLTIYRADYKLNYIITVIINENPNHPVAIADIAAKEAGIRALFSVRKLIGIYLPFACCIILIILALSIRF